MLITRCYRSVYRNNFKLTCLTVDLRKACHKVYVNASLIIIYSVLLSIEITMIRMFTREELRMEMNILKSLLLHSRHMQYNSKLRNTSLYHLPKLYKAQ
mgnify:CR=1 FL=1